MAEIQAAPVEKNIVSRRSFVRSDPAPNSWTSNQKIIFRIAFAFFVLMAAPTSWSWVERVWAIDLSDITYRDLYDIAGFNPRFYTVNTESGRWGIASYANWGVVLLAATLIGLVWTFFVRNEKREHYNNLYYWLRVLVRYRIAVGLIAFGFIKLFPQQMPPPSLAVQDTFFGDFQAQKLYWYSVGIVQKYEIVLGFVEVLAGSLMFWRKTTALGAALTIAVLGNIGLANHAYDGGVHVYSFYFVVLAVFLLVYEFPVIWKLLFKEQTVEPADHSPIFVTPVKRYILYGMRLAIIFVYLPFFTYVMYANNFHKTKINKNPVNPGLAGARGNYAVSEFRVNNKIIPYSPLDSTRWQSATFEKWSTLTFKVNKPVRINLGNGGSAKKDVDKNFELAGIAGGRRFFYYDIDSLGQKLLLQDKNTGNTGEPPPNQQGRNGSRSPTAESLDKPKSKRPVYALHYERPTEDRIILSGVLEGKDSIYAILDRTDRPYPLTMGRK